MRSLTDLVSVAEGFYAEGFYAEGRRWKLPKSMVWAIKNGLTALAIATVGSVVYRSL